jgi:hypothetical protein
MQNLHRLMIATIVAFGLSLPSSMVSAQAVKQIQLTEKQVLGYIAAQKEMPAVPENPDAKIQAQLESVAKKNGFASFAEFDDVASNISMIVDGLDPKTKAFTEPLDGIKKEIAEVQADKSIPARERQAALKELNEALKTAQPIQFRGNIELVKKHYDKLQPAQ